MKIDVRQNRDGKYEYVIEFANEHTIVLLQNELSALTEYCLAFVDNDNLYNKAYHAFLEAYPEYTSPDDNMLAFLQIRSYIILQEINA
jgi:hypothetical protein